METRTCSRCGADKPLEEFYLQEAGRGGRMSQCRTCNNSRRPTASRLVRNRARSRAYAVLAERHPTEYAGLLEQETVKAQAEHDRITAEAAAKGNHDATTARIKPGPKRQGETSTVERIDVARCPNCQTHHQADHQCPGCGAFTPREPSNPTLLGKPTPAWVIREWAFLNDVSCAPRGPIPKDVVARFLQSHRRAGVDARRVNG
jgi:ribosomal protein L32